MDYGADMKTDSLGADHLRYNKKHSRYTCSPLRETPGGYIHEGFTNCCSSFLRKLLVKVLRVLLIMMLEPAI